MKDTKASLFPTMLEEGFLLLTAVGLLPIAVGGISIDQLMSGALYAYSKYSNPDLSINECYQYAAIRNIFYNEGKTIEIMVNYEPMLHFFSEWWKQLFGESEGKDQKGIFPAAVDFTTDLHSMGQYIQDGREIFLRQSLMLANREEISVIKGIKDNLDGLNFLASMDIDHINKKAMEGTLLAHTDGGVPNMIVTLPEITRIILDN